MAFSGVPVLKQISLQVYPGEILGIIGENGAGKSTLMKILAGIYSPTEGTVYLEGQTVSIRDPFTARSLGISLVPQEFNLVQDLSIRENIFLGTELLTKYRTLDKKRMHEQTRSLLQTLGVALDPEEKIETLSAAKKQMVEIAKALAFEAKLIILDEPTTVLTRPEIEVLFQLIRTLQKEGKSIIYISHKLREVKEICSRVLVLRDGEVVAESPTSECDLTWMATQMIGRELSGMYPPRSTPGTEVILEVKNLCVPGLLKQVCFQLHRGEILGLAGLVGAGRTEVAETILGIRKRSSGSIYLEGREVQIRSVEDAVKAGISYLSEDRQGSGIITSFPLVWNVTLLSLPRYLRKGIFIQSDKEYAAAESYRKLFNIKTQDLDTRLEHLSGGNQQKVSLAKSIDIDPKVLIIDEPTRGVDVAAKQEIYSFIHALSQRGIACLLISSELEEILGMCHRVVVMKEGEVTGILGPEKMSETEIMFHATGILEGGRS